jgi:NTP pyrophosphatase (non-canonical NTP hydrolase)
MNRSEHLLCCLAEECNEVGQRVSKALRFGLAEVQPGQALSNADRIVEEIRDLFAVVEILDEAGVLVMRLDDEEIAAKKLKVEKFMRYAEEQGALLPGITAVAP